MGDVVIVSAKDRFTVAAFGSTRVGCRLCDTGPMMKWCWHAHALSKKHVEKTMDRTEDPESVMRDFDLSAHTEAAVTQYHDEAEAKRRLRGRQLFGESTTSSSSVFMQSSAPITSHVAQ